VLFVLENTVWDGLFDQGLFWRVPFTTGNGAFTRDLHRIRIESSEGFAFAAPHA
jgi:hypothetical protein